MPEAPPPTVPGGGLAPHAVAQYPDDSDGRLLVAETTRHGLRSERFRPGLPAIEQPCVMVAALLTRVDDEAALAALATPEAAAIAIVATENPLLPTRPSVQAPAAS